MYVLNHILQEVTSITVKPIYQNLANRTLIFSLCLVFKSKHSVKNLRLGQECNSVSFD